MASGERHDPFAANVASEPVPNSVLTPAAVLTNRDIISDKFYAHVVDTNRKAKCLEDITKALLWLLKGFLEPCQRLLCCIMVLCVLITFAGLGWCSTFPIYHLKYNNKHDLSVHQDSTLLISDGCSSPHAAIGIDAVCQFFDLCDITSNALNSTDITMTLMRYGGSYGDNLSTDDKTWMVIYLENFDNDSNVTTTQHAEQHYFSISQMNFGSQVMIKAQWFVSAIIWIVLYNYELYDMDPRRSWVPFFFFGVLENLVSWNFRGIGSLQQKIGGCSVLYTPYYNSLFVAFLYASMLIVAFWALAVNILLRRAGRNKRDLKLREMPCECGRRLANSESANRFTNISAYMSLIIAAIIPTLILLIINLQQSGTRPSSKQNTSTRWLVVDIFLTQITVYFVSHLDFSSLWFYANILQNIFFLVLLIVIVLKFLQTFAQKTERQNAPGQAEPLLPN